MAIFGDYHLAAIAGVHPCFRRVFVHSMGSHSVVRLFVCQHDNFRKIKRKMMKLGARI